MVRRLAISTLVLGTHVGKLYYVNLDADMSSVSEYFGNLDGIRVILTHWDGGRLAPTPRQWRANWWANDPNDAPRWLSARANMWPR